MSFRHLKSLFNPRSIAVIGASARERRMGNVLMRNLLSGQFAGPIMPVNPRRTSVAGVLTYPRRRSASPACTFSRAATRSTTAT